LASGLETSQKQKSQRQSNRNLFLYHLDKNKMGALEVVQQPRPNFQPSESEIPPKPTKPTTLDRALFALLDWQSLHKFLALLEFVAHTSLALRRSKAKWQERKWFEQ
jgi:hypothetical protein